MIKKILFLFLSTLFALGSAFSMLSDCGCKKPQENEDPKTQALLKELLEVRDLLAGNIDYVVKRQSKLDNWEIKVDQFADDAQQFLGGAKKIKRTIEFKYFLGWAMIIASTVGGGYLLWKFRDCLLNKIKILLSKKQSELNEEDVRELELITSLG